MDQEGAGMASASHHFASSLPDIPLDQHRPSMSNNTVQQQPTPGADDTQPTHAHDELCRHDHDHTGLKKDHFRKDAMDGNEGNNISIHSGSKHAEMAVETFLSKHIPTQYNPIGAEVSNLQKESDQAKSNTKFCYRHRPDVKCRRQANEPSMDQLQNELASLSQNDQQAISHVWSLFSAAPAKHRNLMLQGILTQCCFPQLSFISANIRDLIKIDFISALPAELAFNILCYLDTASLCKAAQVSQRWRALADDDVVWHKMCEQHIDRKCTKCGWGLPLLERKRLRTEKRKIQLRATGRGMNEWSPDITPAAEETSVEAGSSQRKVAVRNSLKRFLDEESEVSEIVKKRCSSSAQGGVVGVEGNDAYFAPRKRPWKDVYKDRYKVGTAWKHGRCTTKVFRGHTNGVMCLQFDDNILITGSYDTTVKVWDVNTGEVLRTLTGHTSGIRCLQFDETKVMTGSLDSTLRMWDWRTGALMRTFNAHSDGIICLHFTPRYVATGSRDRTIRIFDTKVGCTFILRGHTDWVNSVKIDEESQTLFSASDDMSIRIWDLVNKECIRTFTGHVGQVQQVVPMPVEFDLEGHHIEGGQDDDAGSESGVTVAPSHQEHVKDNSAKSFWPNDPDRPAPPRYMFTAALDSQIRLWDTHWKASDHPPRAPTPQDDTGSEILPTDPLTNSHKPRAEACLRTYFGHVEGIWALAADHLRLVSGSEDTMMKVWDPRTGKCERTFTGHQGPVTCAWLSDSRVASGSEDCDVRMLCFEGN